MVQLFFLSFFLVNSLPLPFIFGIESGGTGRGGGNVVLIVAVRPSIIYNL